MSCPSPTVPRAHENQESVCSHQLVLLLNSRKRPVCYFVCFISNSMWPKIFQFKLLCSLLAKIKCSLGWL